MDCDEKRKLIQSWVSDNAQVTVELPDGRKALAQVLRCTDTEVELALHPANGPSRETCSVLLDEIILGEEAFSVSSTSSSGPPRERVRLTIRADRPPSAETHPPETAR